jgi:CubicO group peptidase (beta-lactamase class C family)
VSTLAAVGRDPMRLRDLAAPIGKAARTPVVSVAQFSARVARPGPRWHYASAEIGIPGLILRTATGKPVANYLSETPKPQIPIQGTELCDVG